MYSYSYQYCKKCEWSCIIHPSELVFDIFGSYEMLVRCLAFHGTFSTNRLYRAIWVQNISHKAGNNTDTS